MSKFDLDPVLKADTFLVAQLPLCDVLLMNDSRYPWLILVPRRDNVREIYQLSMEEQQQLLKESSYIGAEMMKLLEGHKLNVAALGNVVAQLHVHHIVRYEDDAAWPAPVWGKFQPVPYKDVAREELLMGLRHMIDRFA